MVESERTGAMFLGPGIGPVSLRDASAPGMSLEGHLPGLRALQPGGADVAARLADCDADGVDAEILYPTCGLFFFGTSDADYRRACISVYNDWLGEFCAQAPTRLFGLAMLDADDPAWAAEELARGRAMGFVGGVIPGRPPAGHYGEERFHVLWKTASELGMPISIHAFSDREATDRLGSGISVVDLMHQVHQMQRTLALFVLAGVLPLFPGLRLVSSEFDAGWVPHFLERLDRLAARHAVGPDDQPPSHHVRTQVAFGFQCDHTAIELRSQFGPHALLWGSDYPHVSSFWPHSREVLDELLVGVPASERAAITGGNAIALYGLPRMSPRRQPTSLR
jgi:predicted TIM-barrel fold metal-dependent hydrolase